MIDPATILAQLRELPHETEWVEFKAARSDFDFRELCKYVSALANEANLHQEPWGWLVFGVENQTHAVIGTGYRTDPAKLDALKHEVASQLSGGHSIAAIHALDLAAGRVLLFQIPAAPLCQPVAYQRHYYGRDGESLAGLTLNELDRIRAKPLTTGRPACARRPASPISIPRHWTRLARPSSHGWSMVSARRPPKRRVGMTRPCLNAPS